MHQLVYEQKPEEFEKDLAYSIKTLENITGQKVKYFRAPGFSITENEKWAFDILVKLGIEIDCSILFTLEAAISDYSPTCSLKNGLKIPNTL